MQKLEDYITLCDMCFFFDEEINSNKHCLGPWKILVSQYGTFDEKNRLSLIWGTYLVIMPIQRGTKWHI